MVEARERSGALITADFALEEGRDVLAVPGEITSSLSAGTNALLRLGAAPVTCCGGRARSCTSSSPARPTAVALGPEAPRRSSRGFATRALTADELVRASESTRRGAAALVELELAGRVTLEDGVYRAAL